MRGGGGGAVRFRLDTKSRGGGERGCPLKAPYEKRTGGGGGGGRGGCRPALQARYIKRGGGGCLAEKGGGTLYETCVLPIPYRFATSIGDMPWLTSLTTFLLC